MIKSEYKKANFLNYFTFLPLQIEKIAKDSPWREAESPVVQHPLLCAEMSEAQFANVAANVELFGGRILSNIQQSPAIWPRWELFKFCLYTLGGACHH